MKLLRSSKSRIYRLNHHSKRNYRPLQIGAAVLVVVACSYMLGLHSNIASKASGSPEAGGLPETSRSLPTLTNPDQTPISLGGTRKIDSIANNTTLLSLATATHANVTTTVFWVGEPADSDNDYINNAMSAWDEHWETHYGGYDSPTARNGYAPSAFTPQENPFYFALPYTDFDSQGTHKDTAADCLAYTTNANDRYSWCKNIWIAIIHGASTAYAQWEDVGPFEEDDSNYVLGTSAPKNQFGTKAGLDVSPAVRDYLKLNDVDHTSWHFVTATEVPNGPWKQRVTTSLGSSLY